MEKGAIYLRGGKGLPSIAAQQAALRADGNKHVEPSDDEHSGIRVYMDAEPKRKKQATDDPLPKLTEAMRACRAGSTLRVSHLCIFAVTENDANGRLAMLAEKGVTLRVSSTGKEYRLDPAAAAGLALASEIGSDLAMWRTAAGRANAVEKARLTRAEQGAAWKMLRQMWPLSAGYTLAQIEAATGIKTRTAYNAVKRGELPKRDAIAQPPRAKRRRAT